MGEYSIKAGDNLWNIVKREFKLTDTNDISQKVKEIALQNNIKNPDSIFTGQKIVIDKDAPETPLLTSSSEIKLGSNINTPKFDFSKERPLLATAPTAPPERITPPRDFIKADPKVHGPNPDAPIPERDVSRIKFNNTQPNEYKEENVAGKRYSEDNPSFFAKYLKFDTAVDRMKEIMKKNEEKLQLPRNKKTEKIDDIKTIMDEIELGEYASQTSVDEEFFLPKKAANAAAHTARSKYVGINPNLLINRSHLRKQKAPDSKRADASKAFAMMGFVKYKNGTSSGKITDMPNAQRKGRKHQGYDLIGNSVHNTHLHGVIESAGFLKDLGNFVIIKYSNGSRVRIGHMKENTAKWQGKTVKPNEYIGSVGNTGSSSRGAHADFRFMDNDGKLISAERFKKGLDNLYISQKMLASNRTPKINHHSS